MIRRFISSVKKHINRLRGGKTEPPAPAKHPHAHASTAPRAKAPHHDAPHHPRAPHPAHPAHPPRKHAETPAPAAPSAEPTGERKRRRRRRKKSTGAAPSTGEQHAARTAAPHGAAHAVPHAPWNPASYVVPPLEGSTRFCDLDMPEEILHAVADLGFQYCTPIQAAILPKILTGRDATGRAQTGTGKTAAFLISILTRFIRAEQPHERKPGTPRALIIAPTRELAMQIYKDACDLSKHTPYKCLAVYGGTDYQRQSRSLHEHPVDILAGTPGRLLDFYRNRDVNLREVEAMVIDEADRMLDMGFIPDVRKIMHAVPPVDRRQTLLFSATLTTTITRLAAQWLKDPVTVEIAPETVTLDSTKQMFYIIRKWEKLPLIYNLITKLDLQRVLVFGNRRDETRRLTEQLQARGINAALLSGDVSQNARFTTLERFRAGDIRVLVATDVAARGLHVDAISHVINYNLPDDPEVYVHRIGRTGRAGATGISISFASDDDAFLFPALQDYVGKELKCEYPGPELLEPLPAPTHRPQRHEAAESRFSGGSRNQRGRSRRPAGTSRSSAPHTAT